MFALSNQATRKLVIKTKSVIWTYLNQIITKPNQTNVADEVHPSPALLKQGVKMKKLTITPPMIAVTRPKIIG